MYLDKVFDQNVLQRNLKRFRSVIELGHDDPHHHLWSIETGWQIDQCDAKLYQLAGV